MQNSLFNLGTVLCYREIMRFCSNSLYVGRSIQLLSTFIGSFIIAFTRGWLLALVMLSTVPPIVIAGAIVSKLMTGLSTRKQANYSDAGNIVEQTLGAIRTVSAISFFFHPFPITSNFLISGLPGLSIYYAYLKVVSFNGENQAITKYNRFIRKAYQSSLQEGVVSGLGFGSVMATLFSSYGLAVWYGSKLIVERGYNGGMVISIIMAVIMGAM